MATPWSARCPTTGGPAGEARDQARATLAAQWVDGEPRPAPALQAELDRLAGEIAAGAISPKKAFAKLGKLHKAGELMGGAVSMNMIAVVPGEAPDLSGLSVAPGATCLSIGQASGDFGSGSGIEQTVLLIVTATTAR